MQQGKISPGLRPFLQADAPRVAALARASIETLAEDYYDDDQRAAWSARFDDADALAEKLSHRLALVAIVAGKIAGFATLKDADELDMLYVSPELARQGVGSALVNALEKLAAARGAETISADVSDAAREFFAKRGYLAQRRNTVQLAGEWLGNTTMTKKLAADGLLQTATGRPQ
jgi:putative acetyltransferase